MSNKGLTLMELLVSTMILSILMLALADFALDILNVADRHSQGIEKAANNRITNERILEQVHNSEYIFPKGYSINVSTESMENGIWNYGNETIDTDEDIAMLVPANIDEDYGYSGDTKCYNLVAYYTKSNSLEKTDLYEFTTNWPSYCWEENTIPNISSAYGTSTKLSEKIQADSIDLSLILSQEGGSSDTVLKSKLQGATEDSSNALIKGIELSFTQNNPEGETDVIITGLSRKIPRYIDEDL